MILNGKPTAIVFSGPPAVGKTTYTIPLTEHMDYVVLSVDEHVENIAREQGKTYGEVWADSVKQATKLFNESLTKAIRDKKEIAIDRTCMTRKSRGKFIKRLKENGYYVTVLTMSADKDILIERLEKRGKETGKTIPLKILNDMLRNYDDPLDKDESGNYIEEWDAVMVFENGKLVRVEVQNEDK